MDSTGIPGYTQVTQEVVDALQGSHFQFRCRGTVKVKGKGDMITYLLVCDQQQGVQNTFLSTNLSNSTSNATNNNSNNGGVVLPIAANLQQQQENNVNLNQNINKNYHPHMKLQINEPTYAAKKESYNFGESPNLLGQQQIGENKFKPNYGHYHNQAAVSGGGINSSSVPSTAAAASSSNNFNITENLSHSAQYYNQHPQMSGSETFNYSNNNSNIRTTPSGVLMDEHAPQQRNYNHLHKNTAGSCNGNGNYLMENEPLLGSATNGGAKIIPRNGNFHSSHQNNNINSAPMYEPPRYATNNNNMRPGQQQQQQSRAILSQQSMPQMPHNLIVNRMAHSSSNGQPQNGNHPRVMLKTYMKPLPRSPEQSCDLADEEEMDEDLDARREMSSTDDLSSRPHSPSMSSSDESYSKTTEGEFDEEDQNNRHFNRDKAQEMFRQNQLKNPMQWLYPCDIQVDPTSPGEDQMDGAKRKKNGKRERRGMTDEDEEEEEDYDVDGVRRRGADTQEDEDEDLEYDGELDSNNTHVNNLRDCEVSSTTESQGPASTAQNTKGESCASFEYQNHLLQQFYQNKMNGGAVGGGTASSAGKSPFEREIQRLMMGKGQLQQQQQQHQQATSSSAGKYESVDPVKRQQQQNFSSINNLKHPVGLEAIKEITRNKNPSDSSQMQTSDTESCDMLNSNRRMNAQKHSLVMRTDSGDMSGFEGEERDGQVAAGGFSNGPRGDRRHLQSVNSNHMESQSEWSDDELGRDGE